MKDLTVLYYTANTEDSNFESHIRANILKNMGNLPLISVSQKPIPDFGQNICVGVHDNCYGNEFRQIQIGLQAVKTKYVITAEADVLYPPEYFQFQPTDEDYYRYGNVWVSYVRDKEAHRAFFKLYSDGAQIIKKDFWLSSINNMIGENETWFSKNDKQPMSSRFVTIPQNTWTSENPVLSFKTPQGVARFTSIRKNIPPVNSLPYFGDINNIIKVLYS